ncbi:hypothetical protein [Cedecea sp. FDAARGOS_727]|uniref:hypothetical protein n=1 Tax=Cedecea sp. FDAARGOS_727 TaxID=2545798 RepID=UPI00143E70CE|nr:hypothetical protein [Cedecea sp. FDAARGOS_727]QIX98189.1 hypothetical protein FOC35_21975 [Cedecea sp. FDAARGOS_727]
MKYALITDGIVVNTVIWDGQGHIFDDYEIVKIDDAPYGIGWFYEEGGVSILNKTLTNQMFTKDFDQSWD